MHGTSWSSEKDEQLKARHAKGESYSEIARALGVSKNAVVGRVRRLNLAVRGNPIVECWSVEKDREMVMMINAGFSRQEIGDTLGYSANAVTARYHRIQRRAKKPARRPEKHVGNVKPEKRRKIIKVRHDKRRPELFKPLNKACQYIAGSVTADDSCKCGAPVKGSPYCEEHFGMVYLPHKVIEKSNPAPRPDLRTDFQ